MLHPILDWCYFVHNIESIYLYFIFIPWTTLLSDPLKVHNLETLLVIFYCYMSEHIMSWYFYYLYFSLVITNHYYSQVFNLIYLFYWAVFFLTLSPLFTIFIFFGRLFDIWSRRQINAHLSFRLITDQYTMNISEPMIYWLHSIFSTYTFKR